MSFAYEKFPKLTHLRRICNIRTFMFEKTRKNPPFTVIKGLVTPVLFILQNFIKFYSINKTRVTKPFLTMKIGFLRAFSIIISFLQI